MCQSPILIKLQPAFFKNAFFTKYLQATTSLLKNLREPCSVTFLLKKPVVLSVERRPRKALRYESYMKRG